MPCLVIVTEYPPPPYGTADGRFDPIWCIRGGGELGIFPLSKMTTISKVSKKHLLAFDRVSYKGGGVPYRGGGGGAYKMPQGAQKAHSEVMVVKKFPIWNCKINFLNSSSWFSIHISILFLRLISKKYYFCRWEFISSISLSALFDQLSAEGRRSQHFFLLPHLMLFYSFSSLEVDFFLSSPELIEFILSSAVCHLLQFSLKLFWSQGIPFVFSWLGSTRVKALGVGMESCSGVNSPQGSGGGGGAGLWATLSWVS